MAIIDVMMPGMHGFALVEQLVEADAVLPPVLYLTARIEVADRVRGLRLGAEDYTTLNHERIDDPFAVSDRCDPLGILC